MLAYLSFKEMCNNIDTLWIQPGPLNRAIEGVLDPYIEEFSLKAGLLYSAFQGIPHADMKIWNTN